MKGILPSARPQMSREEAIQLAAQKGVDATGKVVILGLRGYYKNSMGAVGKNDIGIYDDAIVVITPNDYRAFNGNTDPSKSGRKLAMLIAGLYEFYFGWHKGQYPALRAYPNGVKLPCTRDGVKSMCSFINIHKGGYSGTWSEGCQTIPTSQWDEFYKLVSNSAKELGQTKVPYLLVEV